MRFPHLPYKPEYSRYNDLIQQATGAQPYELNVIEAIMREDVFHSTLDWQSAEEFADGAREAYGMYLSAVPFYRAEMKRRHFSFHHMKTEQKIAEMEQKLARAKASGKAERIAACEKKLSDLRQLFAEISKVLSSSEREMRRELDFCFPSEAHDCQPA